MKTNSPKRDWRVYLNADTSVWGFSIMIQMTFLSAWTYVQPLFRITGEAQLPKKIQHVGKLQAPRLELKLLSTDVQALNIWVSWYTLFFINNWIIDSKLWATNSFLFIYADSYRIIIHGKFNHFHVTRWDVCKNIIGQSFRQSQQCELFMNKRSNL